MPSCNLNEEAQSLQSAVLVTLVTFLTRRCTRFYQVNVFFGVASLRFALDGLQNPTGSLVASFETVQPAVKEVQAFAIGPHVSYGFAKAQ
jgi:hypothetical protein